MGVGRNASSKSSILYTRSNLRFFLFLSSWEIDDFEQAFLDHLPLKRVQMLGCFLHFAHQFFKIKTRASSNFLKGFGSICGLTKSNTVLNVFLSYFLKLFLTCFVEKVLDRVKSVFLMYFSAAFKDVLTCLKRY